MKWLQAHKEKLKLKGKTLHEQKLLADYISLLSVNARSVFEQMQLA
jgi:hypothetical protein